MRVVSLLPSATEILYSLGIEPVAVSHECDYPPRARALPSANRLRITADASSREINAQVAEATTEGGVYEIADDVLSAVDPTLIVTQGICDVCAVDTVLVEDAVDRLGLDATVLTTDPHRLDDVLGDIRRIGDAVDRADVAAAVLADLEGRIETVRSTLADARRPRVAVLDWMDPVMTAGHWIPGMVAAAGGAYGLGEPGDRSRPRAWERILAYDPEVLVIAPCGFTIDETLEDLSALTAREGFGTLSAVEDDRVYVMDGHGHMNRPGPRLIDSLEHLAAILHPDEFPGPPPGIARRIPGSVIA